MPLRRRLFLLLGGLICLLLVGQGLLFRSLSQAVNEDVRTVALRVGEEILSGFSYRMEAGSEASGAAITPAGAAGSGSSEGRGRPADAQDAGRMQVFVLQGDAVDPALREPGSATTGQGAKRRTIRREIHFRGAESAGANLVVGAAPVPESGGSAGEEPLRQRIVLETDAARDLLFVRGPAVERTIPIPQAAIASTLDRFGSQLLLGNLALLALGLAAAAVVAHRLTRPLASLAEAAERLGEGELGVVAHQAVPVERDDEVGRAIASFNRMSTRLADLDRENRRLASAEQLSELGSVARGLAHSLRNPLNALGLAIEQAGAPGEVVESSRRQIRRMDGALRSFLALASAGSAQTERVDLGQLAREVALEALQDSGGRVRIDVAVDRPADGGSECAVEGVPAELKAALQALVVNAVEASPPGGSVHIRLDRVEGRARIAVEDEGAGLPEAVRARLFEPHVTTKPHGSGMGLFLAHRLVTGRFAGTLTLEPSPPAGTRATIVLAGTGTGTGAGAARAAADEASR
jgi:signal transduction histidine kinase